MKRRQILLILTLAASLHATAAPDAAEELWYRLEIDDEPAGWLHESRTNGDAGLSTEMRIELRFRRGGVEQGLEIVSGFLESADGEPLRAWMRQSLGGAPIETVYEFEGEELVVTTRQGERAEVRRLPAPEGEWLTPNGLERALRGQLASGAESFRTRIFDPQAGAEPIEIDWTLVERGRVLTAAGRDFTISRWRQRNSLMPGLDTLADLTPEGLLVRSETPLMGMTMTATLADREGSEKESARAAPELLAPSFLRPDRPIPDPRQTRRAIYELMIDGNGEDKGEVDESGELPSAGHQRVEAGDGGVRVLVDLGSRVPAELEDPALYLRSSTYLDHQAPRLRALREEALAGLGEDASPAARAEALRQFVYRYLDQKSLDVVLATAGEVARSRAGDCTEHSVLLSALLRAAGIPSRVVAGLIYVDEFAGAERIFAYHMWSQAFLDGRWHDLDATLEAPFDAAHVALATSALDDGATALVELGRVAHWMGRARIRVLEIEH